MNIAIFSDNFFPELSGIADSILTTGRALAARGHRIRYYAPHYAARNYRRIHLNPQEETWNEPVSVVRLPSLPFPTGTGQGRLVIPTGLYTLSAKKFNPDVIHAHLPFGAGLEGMIASRLLKIPLVGTDHTPMKEFVRYSPIKSAWFTRRILAYNAWFYRHAAFLSSPAESVLTELRTSHGLATPGHRVSNPLKLDIYKPLAARDALKKKYGLSKFTVLYAGRLAEEKNIDLIVRAVSKLKETAPEIMCAIAGSGAAEAHLKELAHRLGIAHRVRFFGYIKDEHAFNELYNAADAFVMMSTAETQSIVTMHAMAAGLPVVVARAWGLAEYVTPLSGILVEPEDESGLTNALQKLSSSRALRTRLGNAGKKHVAQFSIENVASAWEDIYERVATEHKRTHTQTT